MKLKCRINEIEYDIVQGATFSEEYNETLDSGSIIITHVRQIKDLKPYDDVFIWDSDYNFLGYDDNGNNKFKDKDGNQLSEEQSNKIFYKHLLVNHFTENMLNIKDFITDKGVKDYEPIYEYGINLFSETKGLETIQLPNVSLTQSLDITKKVSIAEYLERFVNLYSSKRKKAGANSTWHYQNKYKISQELIEEFSNDYPPDFTLNNPNLKDVISQLLITKDMIPYVYNGVIYGLDKSRRKEDFVISQGVNKITGSYTSSNYCDNLKRTYSNALSQNNTAKIIEHLGFRNNDNALMTLGNMRLETNFPIYKIDKMYMCYFKKVNIYKGTSKTDTKVFLCKQDITPLIKLNTERNVLSQDWTNLQSSSVSFSSISELAKYKLFTIGYDIGSNSISGWGEKITYPNLDKKFWDVTKTYIQNIFEQMDRLYPFGIYGQDTLNKGFNLEDDEFVVNTGKNPFDSLISPFSNASTKMKSFVFEVEYQAFYNGTIVHSKDNGLDNITINDNPSSSLTLLEKDGIFAKENLNRYGNKGLTINARYNDISDLQPLGSVYNDLDSKDIIIYHREYQIWNNYIQTVYYGIKNYVLKDYYTSVYARHRTWNLIPYGESVRRSENRKILLLLSKKNAYLENDGALKFKYFEDDKYIDSLVSFFKTTEKESSVIFNDKNNNINYGYLLVNGKAYVCDINVFSSGTSLCFNLCMKDNISPGVFIREANPTINGEVVDNVQAVFKVDDNDNITIQGKDFLKFFDLSNVEDDKTGSELDWYNIVDDVETGYIKTMGFYFSHVDNSSWENFNSELKDTDISNIYINTLFKLPYVKTVAQDDKSYRVENEINQIGETFDIYKDNKEIIDMTYQIEAVSDDEDIMISPLFMQLSDLNGVKQKNTKDDYEQINAINYTTNISLSCSSKATQAPLAWWTVIPIIKIKFIDEEDFNGAIKLLSDVEDSVLKFDGEGVKFEYKDSLSSVNEYRIDDFEVYIKEITSISSDVMVCNVRVKFIPIQTVGNTKYATTVKNLSLTLKRNKDTFEFVGELPSSYEFNDIVL